MAILLYTRRGCHLCDEAEDMLAALGVPAVLVDVDRDADALARYDRRVPVLELDGVVVMEGRFQAGRLGALCGGLTGRAEAHGGPVDRRAAGPT